MDIIGGDMGKMPLAMTVLIMKILSVEMTCSGNRMCTIFSRAAFGKV